MARTPRIFGKKRGHRRTGSKTWGSAGEALFFTFLLAVGTAFLVLLLVKLVVPEWRANHEFLEQTALALEKRLAADEDDDGHPIYRPEVKIRYTLDGRDYERWTYDITRAYGSGRDEMQALVDRIEIGREYLCWYDPLDPAQVVLVRGYSWWFWLLLLVPLGFMLFGGIGLGFALWHWGKSPEHQAARGQLGRIDLFDEPADAAKQVFPGVPHDANLTNSPGTHQKYRLPINTSQGWRLFAAMFACLAWNGIVAGFTVVAIRKHLDGRPDWWLDLFVLPFLGLGGWLIYYFVRQLLIATGVGPTQLEISDHPLWPGQAYQLHLSQAGHLTMNSLAVTLECEEQAIYRQGTDARTERRVVCRQHLYSSEAFEIVPGTPYEADFSLQVPATAMHSFRSAHNEVQWKLVVRGNAAGWPNYERSFPVVVNPGNSMPQESDAHETPADVSVSVS